MQSWETGSSWPRLLHLHCPSAADCICCRMRAAMSMQVRPVSSAASSQQESGGSQTGFVPLDSLQRPANWADDEVEETAVSCHCTICWTCPKYKNPANWADDEVEEVAVSCHCTTCWTCPKYKPATWADDEVEEVSCHCTKCQTCTHCKKSLHRCCSATKAFCMLRQHFFSRLVPEC